MKRDNAFTGLEAAIVLIAFVVVAAVFSYVMLGAGFFATQKAQEVTYAAIKQTTSNVVFEGHMYGNVTEVTGDPNKLVGFTFSVKVPGGGQAVDMSNTDFTYTSTKTIPPRALLPASATSIMPIVGSPMDYPTAGGCTESSTLGYNGYFPLELDGNGVPTSDPTTILQPGDSALYTVCIGEALTSGQWFSLEMIPQIGAPTLTTKRIDAGLRNGRPLL